MLPITRQHICNDVILPRYIVDFKIQFCQTLQPTCLASVEVGLNEYVHQRFMISVYMADVAMHVMPPLHTTKVHTHEFTIGYMVTPLGGGEILAVVRHRTSTLRQISTHSNNRSISGDIKRLSEVRQRQYWCEVNFYFNSSNDCYCSTPQTNSCDPDNKFDISAAIRANDLKKRL